MTRVLAATLITSSSNVFCKRPKQKGLCYFVKVCSLSIVVNTQINVIYVQRFCYYVKVCSSEVSVVSLNKRLCYHVKVWVELGTKLSVNPNGLGKN